MPPVRTGVHAAKAIQMTAIPLKVRRPGNLTLMIFSSFFRMDAAGSTLSKALRRKRIVIGDRPSLGAGGKSLKGFRAAGAASPYPILFLWKSGGLSITLKVQPGQSSGKVSRRRRGDTCRRIKMQTTWTQNRRAWFSPWETHFIHDHAPGDPPLRK